MVALLTRGQVREARDIAACPDLMSTSPNRNVAKACLTRNQLCTCTSDSGDGVDRRRLRASRVAARAERDQDVRDQVRPSVFLFPAPHHQQPHRPILINAAAESPAHHLSCGRLPRTAPARITPHPWPLHRRTEGASVFPHHPPTLADYRECPSLPCKGLSRHHPTCHPASVNARSKHRAALQSSQVHHPREGLLAHLPLRDAQHDHPNSKITPRAATDFGHPMRTRHFLLLSDNTAWTGPKSRPRWMRLGIRRANASVSRRGGGSWRRALRRSRTSARERLLQLRLRL